MRCCRAFLVLLLAGAFACAPAPAPPPQQVSGQDRVLGRDADVIESKVPRNATLAGLLKAHRISEDLIARIVDAARLAFDPRKLRAEHPYRLELGFDGLVRLFEYRIDGDRFLRIVGGGGRRDAPTFDATIVPYEKQYGLVALRGRIDREHPSLVSALQAHGEGVVLAMAVADVFGGDIDFNNDLQPGDSFHVLFERQLSEGQFAGYGPVMAAEFINEGRRLRAFRFDGTPGEPAYYDDEGRSLKRFFLRSPLKFEPRVSSGFSYRRLHPVLGQWRAHPAIDYLAPTGAPVVAVAPGVVVHAGWAGGAGRMVTIRHNNGYESSYLHLSAIAVQRGERVGQGLTIGRVGSTGLATGPHLDYRLKKDGAWVNPLVEHKKLPPGEPIPLSLAGDFAQLRDQQLARFVTADSGDAEPPRLASADGPIHVDRTP